MLKKIMAVIFCVMISLVSVGCEKESEHTCLAQEGVALCISVQKTTVRKGEDFVVDVYLKDQSGEDVSISYHFSPVFPKIDGWQYYGFPLLDKPPTPDILVIENNEHFHETWYLGGNNNNKMDESAEDKWWQLPRGTHDLRFVSWVTINEQTLEIWSNIVKLTVR